VAYRYARRPPAHCACGSRTTRPTTRCSSTPHHEEVPAGAASPRQPPAHARAGRRRVCRVMPARSRHSGTVTVNGPGTQIFSGPNVAPGGLSVIGGAAALHAGAVLDGPAAVQAPGALHTAGAVAIGGLGGDGALSLGLPAPGDASPSAPHIAFLSTEPHRPLAGQELHPPVRPGQRGTAVVNGISSPGDGIRHLHRVASLSLTRQCARGTALGPVPPTPASSRCDDMCYCRGGPASP
jgi:hypothetical protein